jgi:broad specificity phosphatase PhoE
VNLQKNRCFINKIQQPIAIENNLQECCWGIMEGKIKGDCSYNNIPFEPENWWQQVIVPEGAESFTEFSNRVIKTTNDHLAINRNILFVAHSGVIMAILAAIGRTSRNIKNVALYHFIAPEVGQSSWNVNIIK